MKRSKIKAFRLMGGVQHRFVVLALTMVITLAMSLTSFADVTITKDWEDGLTGTAASSREAPTVNLEGATPYEQLLNIFYPVGSCYMSLDPSFNPNVAWGGTWQKLPAGMNIIQAGGSYAFGSTGGEAAHVLTEQELAKHDGHIQGDARASKDIVTNGDPTTAYYLSATAGTGKANYGFVVNHGNEAYPATIMKGGNAAHNNMPPYIAGNIWKRVA